MLQNKSPQILKRIRLAINEKVPQAIFALKEASEQDMAFKIAAIVTALKDEYGMEADVAYELVSYFCFALGFKTPRHNKAPQVVKPAPSPPPVQPTPIITVPPSPQSAPEPTPVAATPSKIVNTIRFGYHDWRILEMIGGKALLLCERCIESKPFHHTFESVTWAKSDIHDYLNGVKKYKGKGFYDTFSSQDMARITQIKIVTDVNPWYGTAGGSSITDKVFLLSIHDVVNYFGDSGQLKGKSLTSRYWIDDKYNPERLADDIAKNISFWWLRSPGSEANRAAYVNFDGRVSIFGNIVDIRTGGIRPALWLKL